MRDFLLKVCRRSGLRLPFLGAVALVVLLGTSSVIDAAPVTFAFEAEIVRVFETVPFDAGVALEVGDTITGRFSFVPDEVGGGGIPGIPNTFLSQQPTHALINVNGVEFATTDGATGITIRSLNNSRGTIFGETDGINISSQLVPSDPLLTPNVMSAGLAVFLQSTSDVLAGAIIPADPITWNQLINFDDRVRLTLRNNSGGSVGFTAALKPGSFAVVPEPATETLVLLSTLMCGSRRRIKISANR